MMKFPFNCRRDLSLSAVVSLALMLTSCHFYKEEKDGTNQEEDLIANIEGYGIDTIAVEPGDTLCSARVDDVLRHYPEFYHAAEKAKKAYEEWQEMEAEARVGTKTQVMSLDAILNDALYGSDDIVEIGEWPDMAPIERAQAQVGNRPCPPGVDILSGPLAQDGADGARAMPCPLHCINYCPCTTIDEQAGSR